MKPQLRPKEFRVRAIVNVKVKINGNVGVGVWARVRPSARVSGSFRLRVMDTDTVSI